MLAPLCTQASSLSSSQLCTPVLLSVVSSSQLITTANQARAVLRVTGASSGCGDPSVGRQWAAKAEPRSFGGCGGAAAASEHHLSNPQHPLAERFSLQQRCASKHRWNKGSQVRCRCRKHGFSTGKGWPATTATICNASAHHCQVVPLMLEIRATMIWRRRWIDVSIHPAGCCSDSGRAVATGRSARCSCSWK